MHNHPRVFVVNEVLRRNEQGDMVSVRDLSAAYKFGELVFLVSGKPPLDPQPSIDTLTEKLADFTGNDYLLLIGHPALIGWAAAIAARKTGGKLNLLQWVDHMRDYVPMRATLWTGCTEPTA